MNGKKWYEGGIYAKVPTRGPCKGTEVFYGRVWVPGRRKRVDFWLGPGFLQAKKRLHAICADPDKAMTDRERARVQARLFGDVLSLFLEKYRTRRGRIAYYETTLKAPRAFFGKMPVTAIARETLDRYVARRRGETTVGVERGRKGHKIHVGAGRRKVSDPTVRKEIIAIGTVFAWSKKAGLVARNPVAEFEKPRGSEGILVALDREREEALLALLPALERDVVEWAIYSGMRRGEILAMRWHDIERARGVVHVLAGKTGKARLVPLSLSARLGAILDRHPRRTDTDLLFHEQDGGPLNLDRLNGVVEGAMKTAGVTKTRGVMWNLFRKTWVSRLYESGRVMPQDEADWGGHSIQIAMKNYRQFSSATMERAAGALDGAPKGAGAGVGAPVGTGAAGAA